MTIRDFAPRPMKLSVLTAAFQELTPRDRRDPDPDLAIEEWLAFARDIGAPNIQLSAALHPTLSDVPEEAMLDPVANTLDLRTPFDKNRAARVLKAMKATGVGLSDLGYFDNMLADDPTARKHKHEFMLRVFDAAALLGANAVCGFVGRNIKLEMDENLVHVRGASSYPCSRRPRPAASPIASSNARCRGGTHSTAGTTTSRTRRARGLPCIASAKSTASVTSSASITTHRTPS